MRGNWVKNMIQKIKKWIPSKRKIMQLYFGLLLNANMKGYITGANIFQGESKIICAPGMNCYSCPGAVGACPLGSLQGSFHAGKSTVFYVFGILMLYGLMFGRMICGWICPFGFIQDLLHKIKTPKVKKSPVTRALSYLKYVLLVFFVVFVPLMYAFKDRALPAFCKYICPAGTLEGGMLQLSHKLAGNIYLSSLKYLFTWKFMLMVSMMVGCIFIFRLFCRFVCPLGALYGLFNRISIFGVKVDNSKCTDCGLCVKHCKVDIKKVGDQECVACGDWVSVCPTKAIVWKGPKIFLKENEGKQEAGDRKKKQFITRGIVTVIMLAALAGVAVYAWREGPELNAKPPQPVIGPTDPTAPDVPYGIEEGNMCYGAELETVTAEDFTGEKIDPTKTGKVTVINFWGTWCPPCVAELPDFEKVAQEYAGEVNVFAVHSLNGNGKMVSFIQENYPNSEMVFLTDYGEKYTSEYFNMLTGGVNAGYPRTVVIDAEGVIVKIFPNTTHYTDLKAAVEQALAQ